MTSIPERAHALDLLQTMVLMRRFEEKSAEMYTQMKIRGFLHLYVGEEAVGTGIMQALQPDDAVVATYREHGLALARGISARAIMAEMFGKQEGSSRGRGGSMHIFDAGTRFYGGNAIVGGGLPIALGLALADDMQKRRRVTCCVFGEGAVAEGEFHESMNLAALWRLPVLFVCENNLYAMGTRLDLSESVTDITRKAAAYGIEAKAVDGMDVLAVEATAREAAESVRARGGPRLVECRTYRFRAHSMFDAELYRTKEEVAEWKNRDPVEIFKKQLVADQVVDMNDIARVERKAGEIVDDAVQFAEAGHLEPVEDLTRFVYSERGA